MSEGTRPEPPATYAPGAIVGLKRYVVERLLGQGGMSEVYAVRAVEGSDAPPEILRNKTYAIKFLKLKRQGDARFRARLSGEATALRELRHPNLVPCYDAGVDGPIVFLVMERLEGRTLADILRFEKRLSVLRALDYAIGIADALAYVNKAGIVHRDVKPDNIMIIASTNKPVLFDLGAAKFERYGMLTTANRNPVGTALYMSPEHIDGQSAHIDGRADVYSLGSVLFLMLTGQAAILDYADQEVTPSQAALWQIGKAPRVAHEVRPDIPKLVSDIVARCLRKDKRERWASNEELADRLRAARAYLLEKGVIRAENEPGDPNRTVIRVDATTGWKAHTEESAVNPSPVPSNAVHPGPSGIAASALDAPTDEMVAPLIIEAAGPVVRRPEPPTQELPPDVQPIPERVAQLAAAYGPKGTRKMPAVDMSAPPRAMAVTPTPGGISRSVQVKPQQDRHAREMPVVATTPPKVRAPARARLAPSAVIAGSVLGICLVVLTVIGVRQLRTEPTSATSSAAAITTSSAVRETIPATSAAVPPAPSAALPPDTQTTSALPASAPAPPVPTPIRRSPKQPATTTAPKPSARPSAISSTKAPAAGIWFE